MTDRQPGDYLRPGEDEISGLQLRLDRILSPPPEQGDFVSRLETSASTSAHLP